MDNFIIPNLPDILQIKSTYMEKYKKRLNDIYVQLWETFQILPNLNHMQQQQVLSYFLGLACQAQNITNINLGRASLITLPREWLIKNIEEASVLILQSDEEWEYRRLLEIYWQLDRELVKRLIEHGLKSKNLEIRDIAEETRTMLIGK